MGFARQNKTENPPKLKGLMEATFLMQYFDIVLFMKQKQRNKAKKQRDSNQKAKKKEWKQERKKEKNDRERERDTYIYIYICRRVTFSTTFLPFPELETVPPF